MKTKQILTTFLAVLLAGGSFVSCGGETPSETQADTDTAVIEETEPEETDPFATLDFGGEDIRMMVSTEDTEIAQYS